MPKRTWHYWVATNWGKCLFFPWRNFTPRNNNSTTESKVVGETTTYQLTAASVQRKIFTILALWGPHPSIPSVRHSALSISAIGLLNIPHPVGHIPPLKGSFPGWCSLKPFKNHSAKKKKKNSTVIKQNFYLIMFYPVTAEEFFIWKWSLNGTWKTLWFYWVHKDDACLIRVCHFLFYLASEAIHPEWTTSKPRDYHCLVEIKGWSYHRSEFSLLLEAHLNSAQMRDLVTVMLICAVGLPLDLQFKQ